MKYISLLLICFSSCRQVYDPPALKNSPHYLVVDGFLNNFPDSTSIRLSFTRNLNDTAPGQPETGAVLMIEGDRNSHIPLQEQQNGRYTGLLNLNTTENYRLRITTSQSKVYMSDYVPFKQTPPVDSLTWREDTSAVYFYIHTHDPQNSTTYYRWKFTETWLYHTYLTSNFDYINGTVVSRKSGQQIHDCWKTNSAANVLLASTAQLSQDLVSRFLFNTVSKTTEKISDQYSVEVSQYALTKDQYDYWTELKKSSEDAGSLFDGQPAQLTGNIHCLTNPSEPVMGNLSACSVAKKRIFLTIILPKPPYFFNWQAQFLFILRP